MSKLFIISCMFFLVNGYCQSSNEHKIDSVIKSCLDSEQNYSTASMAHCIIEATKQWDKQLNENYKELLALLSQEQKIRLKESQRKWLEFIDKELELSKQLYASLEGTMWIPVMYETRMKLTKQRTIALRAYIDNLKMIEN